MIPRESDQPLRRGTVAEASGLRGRLALLGSFELLQGGRHVALPPSAQRLVAFLALRRGPLQRAYVAGLLWPDVPEERAHASLRSALWRIRSHAADLVVGDAGRLGLSPFVAVDADELVDTAGRAVAGCDTVDDDAAAAARLVRLAGALLPDWYDEWVSVERERLDQLRLHGLEAVSERLVAAGRHAVAGEAALAAIEVDPLRESAHRALIRVHLAEGNAGAALRQYRFFRRLSHESLGLPPSALMEDLLAAVPVTRR